MQRKLILVNQILIGAFYHDDGDDVCYCSELRKKLRIKWFQQPDLAMNPL